jgi:2-isopropylmalate synthase
MEPAMLSEPAHQSRAPQAPFLPFRRWGDATLAAAPIWSSTDLRDDSQARGQTLDVARKLRLLDRLVSLGLKQIEVVSPAASQTELAFTRRLIDACLIPDDVTIMATTPVREPLVRRMFETLRGSPRAIVSLCQSTTPVRHGQCGLSRREVLRLAVEHTRLACALAEDQPGTAWTLQYHLEAFAVAGLPFAAEVCNAVTEIAAGRLGAPVIINLAGPVEAGASPVFADQIEWMNDHLVHRDAVVLSVHPDSDRDTAVAAAERALMAGAQRVEGCVLDAGVRAGKLDLGALAMNLHANGLAPELDLAHIARPARTVDAGRSVPVHRHHHAVPGAEPQVADLPPCHQDEAARLAS